MISAIYSTVEQSNDSVAVPRGALLHGALGPDSLSGREMEVLLLAARRLSNRQAALRLHIPEATVKRHLANVYAKLEVASRSEASRRALAEGWISVRDLAR